MTIKLLTSSMIFLFIACSYKKQETATNNLPKFNKEENLSKEKDNQDIIQALLDLPEWQWVYHAGNEDKIPVNLLNNAIISSSLKLRKFGQPVVILSTEQLNKSTIKAYVHITKLNILRDTAYFSMNYLYEGAFADGVLIKKKGKWVAGSYSVVEH